jgi:hypothetical protein
VRIRTRTSSPLRKKARQGFRGYPVATVCFYGPTDELATKVAVGIVRSEGEEPDLLERWFSQDRDIRHDAALESEVAHFIIAQGVKSVVMTNGIIGCPHEEGIDYPEGTSCPKCPYWAGRDRFTKERVQ